MEGNKISVPKCFIHTDNEGWVNINRIVSFINIGSIEIPKWELKLSNGRCAIIHSQYYAKLFKDIIEPCKIK